MGLKEFLSEMFMLITGGSIVLMYYGELPLGYIVWGFGFVGYILSKVLMEDVKTTK